MTSVAGSAGYMDWEEEKAGKLWLDKSCCKVSSLGGPGRSIEPTISLMDFSVGSFEMLTGNVDLYVP